MSKPFLLLGRNSSLVRAILPLLKQPFELASHADLNSIDWSRYAEVFVFSWPKRDFDQFLQQLDFIPTKQLIFISTTAVLALQRRHQWASYPREKHRFEQHILARGGRVMRIGVTTESHAERLVGAFPFTSTVKLAHSIDTIRENFDPVIHAFEIRLGKAYGWRRLASMAFQRVSLALPSIGPLQMVLQGLAKSLGLKHYGYTADANYFFRDTLQVGYGALGRYGPKLRLQHDLILTSPLADDVLNSHGFSNTRLGLSTTGLARLWHGVELLSGSQPDVWRKRVPLWIDRAAPPKRLHASLHVDRIVAPVGDGPWTVLGQFNHQSGVKFWCRRLVLAAGPINNARLLQCLVPVPTTFSDHEICMVGTVSLDDAVSAGLVRRRAFLMQPDQVRSLNTDCGLRFLVEARPHVPGKHWAQRREDTGFYLDSTAAITYKLLKGLDFNRLNEAIFNKFGCAIATKNCSIFVQVLVSDAIKLRPPESSQAISSLHRVRLTTLQWQQIQDKICHSIPNFQPDFAVSSVDAQHILGGASLMTSPQLAGALGSGILRILGSPTLYDLDERHHTCRLQREIRATSQPILLYLPEKLRASGCHDEHVTAITDYAQPWPVCIASGFGSALPQLVECRAVFFQKSALSNIPLALVAAWHRIPRILYLHEPLSVLQRRQKGVPWSKAVLVTLFQAIEVRCMNRLLTGNPANKKFNGRPLDYAPLLLPPVDKPPTDWRSRRGHVLYFGRLDREKFFDKFQDLPLDKTVIATSNLNVSNYDGPVLPVSLEEKTQHFQTHRFVWCVQKNSLTQSGVVIDAIKFGCCCILRQGDPIRDKLHSSAYVEISIDFKIDDVLFALKSYTEMYPSGPVSADNFSQLCGQHVFDQYWRPLLLSPYDTR
jgi:hypothetical protein